MSFEDCTTRVQLDDHVKLDDKRTGKILYIGKVKFATGDWYGIALDDPHMGKNDGTVRNKRYFTCRKNKGAFVRKERIVEVMPGKKARVSSFKVPYSVSSRKYTVGQRVNIDGRMGSIRWIGELNYAKSGERYLGVELDMEYNGDNDGSMKGKRYFSCTQGQGIFLKIEGGEYKEDASQHEKTRFQISEDKRVVLEERLSTVEKELEETHSELAKRISEHEQKTKEAERLLDATKRGALQQIKQLESKLKRAEQAKSIAETDNKNFKQKLSDV